MATMGVRINQGLGSAASTKLADTLAAAFFGDADAAREDALARSRIATDEYSRRQIESATEWNRIRAERDAAELAAQQAGQVDIQNRILDFLNRGGGDGAAAVEAPAPVAVEYPDLPANVPIPTARPEAPVAVDLGFTENQSAFPARPAGPQLPMPAVQDPGMVAITGRPDVVTEPDYSFSTYPLQSDAPVPVVTGQPSIDAAMLRARPPDELAPLGQPLPDLGALQDQLAGLPDELQPVSVPPAPFREGITTTIPGRTIPEVPVPVEPDVLTGPPGAYEARPAPEMPVPIEDLAVPGRPIQGPPVPLEAEPAGPPTATGDIYPEGQLPPQTQQLMPGEVKPQPDGSVAVGTKAGTRVFTAEDVDGIAAIIAFANDPAGQFGGFMGRLDIANRGETAQNTSLITGQPTPRSSIFGTDEEIRLQTEVEKAKPQDLKKNVITEGGRTEELYVDPVDKQIKVRPVPGGQPADQLGGTSDTQTFLRNIRDTALDMNDPTKTILPEQALNYELAYNTNQQEHWEERVVQSKEPGKGNEVVRVLVPPVDLSNYPTPAQVRTRAGLPAGATTPQPAQPAPAQQTQPAPAQQPQPARPDLSQVPPDLAAAPQVAVPEPAPAQAPAAGGLPADPGGTPEENIVTPTEAPDIAAREAQIKAQTAVTSGDPRNPPIGIVQGKLIGTAGYQILVPAAPKERTEFQSRAWKWLIEAADSDRVMKTIEPPHWIQEWLNNPQQPLSFVISGLRANFADENARIFASAAGGFINSEGRINSGAAIQNFENNTLAQRFIDADGDTPKVKTLKASNRQTAMDGVYDVLKNQNLMTADMEAALAAKGYKYGGSGTGPTAPAQPRQPQVLVPDRKSGTLIPKEQL